jgi:CRP-like cAMP-binding protein
MKETQFKQGETVYSEGDASDCAYIIASGTVEVSRAAGETTVPLSHLHTGQIFGEIGVIRDKPRSTSTRAATDVTLLTITKQDFEAAFGDRNPLALSLLKMLCERLSDATQRIYENQLESAAAVVSDIAEIRLRPGSPEIETQIGRDGVTVDKLPFAVGRRAVAGETAARNDAELLLRVTKPYEMAPRHFVIEEQNGGLAIRDLGTVLGTLVNGIRIAPFEQSDSAPLKLGVSEIQAGGLDSTARFTLVVTGR